MITLKRALDLAAGTTAAIVLGPVMAGTAFAVRVSMGGPVIFKQKRTGHHGRPFTIYKFRTMKSRGSSSAGDSDANRLTRLGRLLRATSLDELPELYNVLKGEMSLVGPRPLLIDYLELYSQEQARRHDVKPGITGWAQVNGRNAVDWEERFRLDTWYVDHRTNILDIKILFMTVGKVIRRSDINQDQHATMPRFAGPADGVG